MSRIIKAKIESLIAMFSWARNEKYTAFLDELRKFNELTYAQKIFYLNELQRLLSKEEWDCRDEIDAVLSTMELIKQGEEAKEKTDCDNNSIKMFWTSFKAWINSGLLSSGLLKDKYVIYDNWNGGTYYLNIDWKNDFPLYLGVEYQDQINKEIITIVDLKNIVEMLYSNHIAQDKRYTFTIDVNNRLSKYKLPYKLAGGKIAKNGIKTTEDNPKIINWQMFDSKIRLAEEKILSTELLDKHTAINYLSDSLEYLLSLIKKEGKKIEQTVASLVAPDENSKMYSVIKNEIVSFHTIINEYYDIRHNEYLNKAKEDREALVDKLFIEYLYNRIFSLLFIVKNSYLRTTEEKNEQDVPEQFPF